MKSYFGLHKRRNRFICTFRKRDPEKYTYKEIAKRVGVMWDPISADQCRKIYIKYSKYL